MEPCRGTVKEAWVLFLDRPLVVTTGVPGDFNGSADLDIEDLDLLAAELRSDRNVDLFDVNDDAIVDFEDRRYWVHDLAGTHFGDSNLDGQFNSIDVVNMLQAGEYEDSLSLNSTWSTGDWDGDGDFTRKDLVLALADGGYAQGPRAAVAAIPEPPSIITLLLAIPIIKSVLRRAGKGRSKRRTESMVTEDAAPNRRYELGPTAVRALLR